MAIINAEVSVDTFFALRYAFLNHMMSNVQLYLQTFLNIMYNRFSTKLTYVINDQSDVTKERISCNYLCRKLIDNPWKCLGLLSIYPRYNI